MAMETNWVYDWNNRDKNYLELPGGRLYQSEIFGWGAQPGMTPTAFVDRLLQLMDLRLPAAARAEIIVFCQASGIGYWSEAVLLSLVVPAMHVA